jgi:hypothetical protein
MATVLQPRQILVAAFAGWINRHQDAVIEYLREENRVLKQQLGRRRLRLTDAQRRRLAIRGKAIGRRALAEVASLVTPDTVRRWHRQLIAKKWPHKRRSVGRRRIMQVIAELTIRMARENPRWGYTRIQGALQNVGHRVGRTTIANILQDNGIDPAPERGKRTPWSQFLFDGFLAEKKLLILDRDSKFSSAFRDLLDNSGVEVVPHAERFVRSIKDECLSRMIFFGERSLRKATREYAAHYHGERNHQGIDNRLIEPDDCPRSTISVIECVQRLGGMLRFYHRAAA